MKKPLAGLVLLSLLAIYGWGKWQTGELADLLWASPVTSGLLALGLPFGWRWPAAIGFLFHLGVALPAYLLHLLAEGDTNWASVLLHALTPVLGWWAWQGQRLPRATALSAWGVYLALVLVCRFATPEAMNVNLAFKPWAATPVPGEWVNRILNATLVLVQLFAAQWLFHWVDARFSLRRLG